VRSQPREREDAVNEIRVLASIKHRNIVRYCDAFVEKDSCVAPLRICAVGRTSVPCPGSRSLALTHLPPRHYHTTRLQALHCDGVRGARRHRAPDREVSGAAPRLRITRQNTTRGRARDVA
jgi:hypothetical protein